jgi:lipoprotein LprG
MLRVRLAAVVAALAGLALIAGCSSGGDTPSSSSTPVPTAAELISASAAAMRTVTTSHFTLAISGSLPAVIVQSAEGDLTSSGDATGKGTIRQLGQLVEVEFVFLSGDLYLKGPTGGFTTVPAALAGSVYDPTVLLDPQRGVVRVLTSATDLGPVTGSYTLTGKVPRDVAASLAPGVGSDVDATFTIDPATSQLTAVSLALTGSDGQPATIRLELSGLNAPVTITPPA